MIPDAPIVEVRGLEYRYPDSPRPILDRVDFSMAEGETVILLGPNGAGKSSFLLSLLGVLDAQGHIAVCGHVLSKQTLPAIRRAAALLMQDPMDQLFLPTVMDETVFGFLQAGVSAPDAVTQARELLRQMRLEEYEKHHPYHLSLGEKRRLALAAVLSSKPRLLLLDEPTTHLDPPARRHLVALLRDLPISKIVVTHDLFLARQLGHRCVFFRAGRIVAQGNITEVVRETCWED